MATTVSAISATAHEFWLDPESFRPGIEAADDSRIVLVNTRIGEDLKGSSFPFNPTRVVRSDALIGDETLSPSSRIGDRPALSYSVPTTAEGLLIVVHQAANESLTYGSFEKFERFVDNKALDDTAQVHRQKAFPDSGFKEIYGRYAKSLIALGDGTGADREVGLEVEIVALTNPFTDDLSDGMRVRSLYKGEARGDSQIEVFEQAPDGVVTSFKLMTDAKGEATIPVKASHRYLVDAVKMRLVDPETGRQPEDVLWESLWASLTFQAPPVSSSAN